VTFWKRSLPVAITFFFGVLLTAQYYVPHPSSEALLSELSVWNQIIAGFALILGAASLLQTHTVKIRRQEAGWGYSVVMYISMFVMLGAGIWSQGKTEGTVFGWLYDYVMVALQGTMFSLLAFFIASAAYRAFRARTTESAILLLAAVLVMFGRVPLGEYLISGVGQLSDWIMSVPNTAAQRGILIGVSLGGIATSIKIICGIERSYLGEGKE
jgi:cytochrome bd-type quinol oxidase subunit 2